MSQPTPLADGLRGAFERLGTSPRDGCPSRIHPHARRRLVAEFDAGRDAQIDTWARSSVPLDRFTEPTRREVLARRRALDTAPPDSLPLAA